MDDWKENKDVQNSYLKAMRAVKKEAEKRNYETVLCIPYYMDEYPYLKELVSQGCDGLAVMNYYRKNEALHIETEAGLCKKYHKRLIHIYEFQKVGRHSLEEMNTYYDLGYDAIKESFEKLKNIYNEIDMCYAIHDYDAFNEVMENE